MLVDIITIVVATYLIGMLLVGGFIFSAVLKIGGWQEFSDRANLVGGEDDFTSDKAQWLCAFMILCWPAVPFVVASALKKS